MSAAFLTLPSCCRWVCGSRSQPLEEYERGKIADVLESVSYADGEEIITQGDEGDALYFLEAGLATAVKDGEKVFEYTDSGMFFGELALMSNQPRAATVEAKGGETICYKLGRQQFERLVGSCQEVLQRQAAKYLAINAGSSGVAAGPAAPAGAVFDMDDSPSSGD
jgi:CRP-like cAMP-binding protein|eukprot:COSAG01_NODE_4485_length_4983_cov_3.863432_5_plen_166_part_00